MTDHLYRSRNNRMVAGVAGGLAEAWDVDPSLVRLVWALLVIFTVGFALIVYIVMAIVVPEEGDELAPSAQAPVADLSAPATGAAASDWQMGRREAPAARRAARRQGGDSAAPAVAGGFLVILGGFFLFREWLPQLDFSWFWPFMLIGVGVLLLVLAVGPRPSEPGPSSSDQGPAA